MLWKIAGKGLKTPSYLFGTIHLADTRITTLHPQAQKAYDQAAAVFTEVDLSIEAQLGAMKGLMREDEKSIQEVIGKDLTAALNTELKAINPELDAAPFDGVPVDAGPAFRAVRRQEGP